MPDSTEKYFAGGHVRVKTGAVDHHCRTPDFLKGKEGVVELVVGEYLNPEKLAYHKPGLPKHALYQVRFRQKQIWPKYQGAEGDTLVADIYDHWLEPASTE